MNEEREKINETRKKGEKKGEENTLFFLQKARHLPQLDVIPIIATK
jgi:hypothetical protein